jgi:CheY-like chemotaxis protein
MIVLIDEDKRSIEAIQKQLSFENHSVVHLESPLKALEFLENKIPKLIICEFLMARMDGLEFKQVYDRRFPNRKTPFIFNTTCSDKTTLIKSINMGVAAFYTKPVEPTIISAKANDIIRRHGQEGIEEFYGDLNKLSFVEILRFCENKLFSGDLVLWIADSMDIFSFISGKMDDDNDETFDTNLEKAMGAKEGMFLLRTRPFDFSKIADSSFEKTVGSSWYQEQKLGKLSFKLVQGNMFQIQTDFFGKPYNQLVTRVFCRGKKVLNVVSAPPKEVEFEEISTLIETQHSKIEDRIKGDLENGTEKEEPSHFHKATKEEEFYNLMNEGMAFSNNKDFQEALNKWEEALKIDPDNHLLKMNIRIVKSRMKELV